MHEQRYNNCSIAISPFSRSQGNPLKWNRRSNCKCHGKLGDLSQVTIKNNDINNVLDRVSYSQMIFEPFKKGNVHDLPMFRLHIALQCLRLYRKSRGERKSDSRNYASRVLGPAPKPQKCDFYFEQCDMPSKCFGSTTIQTAGVWSTPNKSLSRRHVKDRASWNEMNANGGHHSKMEKHVLSHHSQTKKSDFWRYKRSTSTQWKQYRHTMRHLWQNNYSSHVFTANSAHQNLTLRAVNSWMHRCRPPSE